MHIDLPEFAGDVHLSVKDLDCSHELQGWLIQEDFARLEGLEHGTETLRTAPEAFHSDCQAVHHIGREMLVRAEVGKILTWVLGICLGLFIFLDLFVMLATVEIILLVKQQTQFLRQESFSLFCVKMLSALCKALFSLAVFSVAVQMVAQLVLEERLLAFLSTEVTCVKEPLKVLCEALGAHCYQ